MSWVLGAARKSAPGLLKSRSGVINGSSSKCWQTDSPAQTHDGLGDLSVALHDDLATGFRDDGRMRNMVIIAMVAFGAVRIAWRMLSPAQPPAFATEWAADE